MVKELFLHRKKNQNRSTYKNYFMKGQKIGHLIFFRPMTISKIYGPEK